MQKHVGLAVIVMGVAGVWGVGCGADASDPFGPEPDFGTVESRFANPDGTFGAANASATLGAYDDQRSATSEVDVGGAASLGGSGDAAGVKPKSLQLLDMAESGSSGALRCAALAHGDTQGTCACPGGGSFRYDFSGVRSLQQTHGPVDVTLKLRLNQCASAKDLTIDGTEFVRLHVERDAGKADLSSVRMLLVADLVATRAGTSHAVSITARIEGGAFDVAVRVDDGWVVVGRDGAGAAGSFRVRARNGAWSCGGGACTSEAGEKLAL
jgi:hypothetical protein